MLEERRKTGFRYYHKHTESYKHRDSDKTTNTNHKLHKDFNVNINHMENVDGLMNTTLLSHGQGSELRRRGKVQIHLSPLRLIHVEAPARGS